MRALRPAAVVIAVLWLPTCLHAAQYWWVLTKAWPEGMVEKTPLFLLDTQGHIVTELAFPLQDTIGADLVPLDPDGRVAGLLVARPRSWHPPLRCLLGPGHTSHAHELWRLDTHTGLPTGQLARWWWQVDLPLTVPTARRVYVERSEPDRNVPEVIEFSRSWHVRSRRAFDVGYSVAVSPDGRRLWRSFEANHNGGLPKIGGVRELDARTGSVLHEELYPGPDWYAAQTVRAATGQVYAASYYSPEHGKPGKPAYFAWRPDARRLARLPFAREGFLAGFSDRYNAFITAATTRVPPQPGRPEPHWRDWRFRHDVILMSARTGRVLRRLRVADNTPEIGDSLHVALQPDGGRRLVLLARPGMRGQPGLLALVNLHTRDVTRVALAGAQPLAIVPAQLSPRDLGRIKRLARHLEEIGRPQAKTQP